MWASAHAQKIHIPVSMVTAVDMPISRENCHAWWSRFWIIEGRIIEYCTQCLIHIHRLLNKSNEMMLEFRALAERVRVCQERLEKQEQALEDTCESCDTYMYIVKPVVCVVTLYKYLQPAIFCQFFQRYMCQQVTCLLQPTTIDQRRSASARRRKCLFCNTFLIISWSKFNCVLPANASTGVFIAANSVVSAQIDLGYCYNNY